MDFGAKQNHSFNLLSGAVKMGKLFTLTISVWILCSTTQISVLELKHFFFFSQQLKRLSTTDLTCKAFPGFILSWRELPLIRPHSSPETVHHRKGNQNVWQVPLSSATDIFHTRGFQYVPYTGLYKSSQRSMEPRTAKSRLRGKWPCLLHQMACIIRY